MNIIFDLDGTLWDATTSISHAWNHIFEKKGLPSITSEDVRGICGMPAGDILDVLQPGHNTEELLAELIKEEEEHLYREPGILFDGMLEVLDELKKKHHLYIVSNCQSGYIETFLETLQLSSYFLDYECWGNTKKIKGENIKLLMERNSLKEAVYIGDTLGDKKAAEDAGIPFIYASYGFGNLESVSPSIESPQDLLSLV